MKIGIDMLKMKAVVDTRDAFIAAKQAHEKAKAEFDLSLKLEARSFGLGKGALVEHVHAAAQHGNLSDKIVISEVCSVFCWSDGRVMLTIRLGTVSGKPSYQSGASR